MDRGWMNKSLESNDYKEGVKEFIKFALQHAEGESKIVCPCLKCCFSRSFNSIIVKDHLLMYGIDSGYKRWTYHGENERVRPRSMNTSQQFEQCEEFEEFEEPEGDTLREMSRNLEEEAQDCPEMFAELINASEQPLYSGCTKFTKLSATLKLYNLKASNGWSDKSFSDLLSLVKDMFPNDNVLPKHTYDAKKVLSSIGMTHEKIHAYPNDCVLYRKEHALLKSCPNPKCKLPRYKRDAIPSKVVWYFPIIPRFRRMFSNPSDAENLTWHADKRVSDGLLRHPADSPQWAAIDEKFPEFGRESRNLRLALSADGMNPHNSGSYSIWLVLLVIYNLPPELCMKRKYMMLSLLISGPKQPGNDIDIYLQPLIDDLKILWDNGVEMFDSYRHERFVMKAMLFCTINDFPAYGNLSGYSVHGHRACPVCMDDTSFCQLKHGKKTIYQGHRRFLPKNHHFRRKRKAFNGEVEHGIAPKSLTGQEIFSKVENLNVMFGKLDKSSLPKGGFKKKSIFFELPYWTTLFVRHCLDAMHVEKNVFDSLHGTLLNVPWKTKDGINSRLDYVEMGIRDKLHPQVKENGGVYLPPACHTLSKAEKTEVCQFLKGLKVPEGFSSNISNLVSMSDLKLLGLKSHDCHVLLHHFLPAAIRNVMPKPVRYAIIRFCYFFRKLCSKVIDSEKLDILQQELVITMCELEMYFPPSFFDIMVHLTVHLVKEVKMCGPVYLRWMYPFERCMKILKGYVKNMHRPEGCIAESYLVEEAIDFSFSYLSNAEAVGIPKSRHSGRVDGMGIKGNELLHMSRDLLDQAHLYILHNTDFVLPYVDEHMEILTTLHPSKSQNKKWLLDQHNRTFADWLQNKVSLLIAESTGFVNDELKWLSQGPNAEVLSFNSYQINGYTFYTKIQDDKTTMQNSGVTLVAEALHVSSAKDKNPVYAPMHYFGVIQNIWELDYTKFRKPLFECKWVDNHSGVRVDDLKCTLVDLNKEGHKKDPFIFASQAKQVFYATDTIDRRWSLVFPTTSRTDDLFLEEDTSLPMPSAPIVNHDEIIQNEDDICIRADHCDGEWIPQDNSGHTAKKRRSDK